VLACMRALIQWLNLLHYYTVLPETIPEAHAMQIAAFTTTHYKISASTRVETFENVGFTARTEADSHADTFVAGKNCIALNFTDRTCGVQPYLDTYDPIPDVPIVTAATGYTSSNGLNYILVVPEALYMPTLDHSLFNPNQLRHFGSMVQDNPYDSQPMVIQNPD
jgi:hypothetical protein